MPDLHEPLSEREVDVLRCAASGASNREIARELDISHHTVKVHLRNVYTKLGVSSRTEATTVALQQGVLSLPGAANGEEANDAPAAEVVAGSAPGLEDGDGAVETLTTPGQQPTRFLALAAIALIVLLALGWLGWRVIDDGAVRAPTTAAETPFVEEPIGTTPWLTSRPLPAPRARMALAPVGLSLYLIGGESEVGVVNDVLVYQTDQRVWSEAAAKLTAVADATAAVLAGEIYVPGGRQANGQPTSAVEVYSPANDAWRTAASLPGPVMGGLSISDGSFLYHFGGYDGERYLAEAAYYDPAEGIWQPLPPMENARAYASGGLAAGQVYVVGGFDGQSELSVCERFDPAASIWSDCPPMEAARSGAGAAVVLNRLYILGGMSTTPSFGERFDAQEGVWERIEMPMLEDGQSWSHLGVANIETRIYALGGQRDEELLAANYVYPDRIFQFFIPAASSGSQE